WPRDWSSDVCSSDLLRKIFLGEKSHWTNGRRITLVMMDPGPERKTVLRDIYRMNENDLNNHFIHGLFTGEVFVSPKTLATPVEVRKLDRKSTRLNSSHVAISY